MCRGVWSNWRSKCYTSYCDPPMKSYPVLILGDLREITAHKQLCSITTVQQTGILWSITTGVRRCVLRHTKGNTETPNFCPQKTVSLENKLDLEIFLKQESYKISKPKWTSSENLNHIGRQTKCIQKGFSLKSLFICDSCMLRIKQQKFAEQWLCP